ncbi:MAG: ATP-binding protein [Crocinitomicaceae bacterium]|nr:ATP-binding protein [Crocinitomicaceae bacterium]
MEVINNIKYQSLEDDMLWLDKVVDVALSLYFKNESDYNSVLEVIPPEISDDSFYNEFLRKHNLNAEERLVLLLALAPILKPQSLDIFKIKNKNLNTEFSEFGGIKEGAKNTFIPTLETAIFILGGDNISRRIELFNKFNFQNPLFAKGILLKDKEKREIADQTLRLSQDILDFILTGKTSMPEFGSKFPAQEIQSKLDWEDLVVNDSVKISLSEIQDWLSYRDVILDEWELKNSLKRGYRALFYGPPGTGKTLAATLIGKSCDRSVFRIDLSMVVSKYIGETEKNLAGLFDIAEGKEWILFFDEADSLFGKRTQAKGSNDRYANQEISYLLQRIEDYQGLVILATNLKDNIDEAFGRRFQTTVQFNKPGEKERAKLWDNYIFSKFELDNDVDKSAIINEYEITGGELINILRFCSIRAAKRNARNLNNSDILAGIKREYAKTNKTF